MPGSRFCVCALNVLQNSMMLRPRWPSAGPIGGDGFALPAGTCSLIIPTIFFAILCPRHPGEARAHSCRRFAHAIGTPTGAGARFAYTFCLHLFDLGVFELDRGRPAEDRHRDLDPRPLLVDLLDRAVERGERTVAHPHLL